LPTPTAARSNPWVCSRSPVGVACSNNPAEGHGYLSPVKDVRCQVEYPLSDCSFVQRSPTECCVSERDPEASKIGRPWPTRGRCTMGLMFSLEKCVKFYRCTIWTCTSVWSCHRKVTCLMPTVKLLVGAVLQKHPAILTVDIAALPQSLQSNNKLLQQETSVFFHTD